MNAAPALGLAAALLMAAPPPGATGGRVIWVGLCDLAHPGTQIPIPIDRNGGGAPATGCHAACFTLPDRRSRR